jgi:hypothetical protein
MKKAIVTICFGEKFKEISEITHPTIKKYADKIKADFIILNENNQYITNKSFPQWEKFAFFYLLNKYDRILYLDTDLIIREDCPNLFDKVPYNQIGAFNEAKFVSREYYLLDTARAYNIDTSKIIWNSKYYNTGVLIISKCHKYLFEKPILEYNNFYEQSYLNLIFAIEETHRTKEDTPLMYDLSYIFNRMTCLDITGEPRYASFIIHYAGYHYFLSLEDLKSLIKDDLKKWDEDKPNYLYKRRIVIVVSGGMGDQIDAEPSLRYLEKVYNENDTEIIITTHWPRLFKHLKYKIIEHKEFIPELYRPFYEIKTFPGPDSIHYSVISNLMCNTVDYCSMAVLQRILPLENKIIKLEVTKEDEEELDNILENFDLSKAILIHPGRHWESKTFPKEWWQEIVDLISKEIPVCLIGTDNHKNRGAFQLNLPDNSINLIDRTSLGVLMAAIKRAPILISNDSSPIHIAGAFNNWIIVIPTCKHPDHILPYRKNSEGSISNYHKAFALYKKLVLDDCDQRPTSWIEGGASAEFIKNDWSYYLPSPKEVYEKALFCFHNL